MIRLIAFLIVLAPLAWAALWLADHPGEIVLQWFGYQIETSLAVLIAILAFAVITVVGIALCIRSIIGMPASIRSQNRLRRQEQGLEALTEVLTAMAIADHRTATKQLKKARYHLGNAPSINLLSAQLAHAKGEKREAIEQFDALMDNRSTRQVALRGKIEQAVRDGLYERAIEFAHEAFEKQPGDRWLALVIVDLYTREEQWLDALQWIKETARTGALSKADRARYESIIHYQRAKEFIANEQQDKALENLTNARRKDAEFYPAQKLAVSIIAESDDKKATTKLIQHFWKDSPQAAYIDTLLHMYSDEAPAKLQKRFERLIATNPEHIESQIAMARCAIHIGKWDLARNYLKIAMTKQESPRTYQLMAQIEKGELNDDKQANEWLKRAVSAPKDPAWHCNRCGHETHDWELHCSNCNSFDSYVWQSASITPRDEDLLIAS
ncbi:MAG: hypothetical protein MRY32_06505 [Rickettsiales bacterium]|nr:hypothetical protein [Rickettsiales bacterium]